MLVRRSVRKSVATANKIVILAFPYVDLQGILIQKLSNRLQRNPELRLTHYHAKNEKEWWQ